ncbi:FAD-dependent 5-carboxymethylaminomethyl-2-thiouridine(34) oxidoreductase MnmC [uncultured Shewanella sp.]|uniref:FAD-dependent 5-carboxymethylaminomethyl-2-thiouridine(34) oxidoreductase MnmC n=1 Tax=uncultured Shewanella sp. TaxID=173975 RepID=UPI0034582AC7
MTVSTLYQYVKTTKTDNSPIILGQIGLSEPQAYLSLLAQHQEATLHSLIIKIFMPSTSCMPTQADLALHIAPEQQTRLINIDGIQRLSLNNERLLIDFHMGELSTQIDEMILSKQQLISHWYCDDRALLCQLVPSQLWKMAKISQDNAKLWFKTSKNKTTLSPSLTDFQQRAKEVGFQCIPLLECNEAQEVNKRHSSIQHQQAIQNVDNDIAYSESQNLRHQQSIKNINDDIAYSESQNLHHQQSIKNINDDSAYSESQNLRHQQSIKNINDDSAYSESQNLRHQQSIKNINDDSAYSESQNLRHQQTIKNINDDIAHSEHQALFHQPPTNKNVDDDIAYSERQALRHQQRIKNAPFPLMSTTEGKIAIIGGGLASAHLALSLASRQRQIHLFCKDSQLAAQASGNKQGALYPLLTPENNALSRYFQQAFLYSRRRLTSLHQTGFTIAHDLCGVLHTGFDERSQARLTKTLKGHAWDPDIALPVNQQQASQLAGIIIEKPGIFYPLGGWVCPEDYTLAAIKKAQRLSQLTLHFDTPIGRLAQEDNQWYLYQGEQVHGPFASVVIANGHELTQFTQTQALQLSGFRGQVSHIPSKGQLSQLNTVLCAHGYLTPEYKNMHCVGASYVKNAADLHFCPQEQNDNLNKMHHSYPNHPWVEDIDVSDNEGRVGVRMVTRDHAPMMGPVPDVEQLLARYQQHQLTPQSRHYWQTTPAPAHQGLYVLGGLGSRGLSSGPLAAEALAAMICDEPLPINQDTLALLSPNRMWMRKLLKGKAL